MRLDAMSAWQRFKVGLWSSEGKSGGSRVGEKKTSYLNVLAIPEYLSCVEVTLTSTFYLKARAS